MSAGLFALICPDCGTELQIDPHGNGTCPDCGQTYLSRFGYLIPVDPNPDDLVDLVRTEPSVAHTER